jgi:hypothetical protein
MLRLSHQMPRISPALDGFRIDINANELLADIRRANEKRSNRGVARCLTQPGIGSELRVKWRLPFR